MKKLIPYGKQNINSEDINAVINVLKSDFITQGDCVPKFENAVCKYTNSKYAVACNSATSALHIACKSLGFTRGDILWTSPISFVASSNCALYLDGTIDFIDIDPKTFNISLVALKKKLEIASKNRQLPKIVMPVHLGGLPCDMKEFRKLSKIYSFKIVEDASHGIGSQYRSGMTGDCRYSDACIFSFHPVKLMTTGEGGIVTTNCKSTYHQLNKYRSHGITKAEKEFKNANKNAWYYEQQDLGYNYRLTDFQAALGTSQLKRLDKFIQKRKRIAGWYEQYLPPNDCVIPTIETLDSSSSLHLYIIKARNRDDLFAYLRSKGILVNLHYIPIYRHPYYQENFNFSPKDFPNSEDYYKSAISLPIYYDLSREDVKEICNSILKFFER